MSKYLGRVQYQGNNNERRDYENINRNTITTSEDPDEETGKYNFKITEYYWFSGTKETLIRAASRKLSNFYYQALLNRAP